MPELPEVETIKKDLSPLVGSRLEQVAIYDNSYLERNGIASQELKKLEGQKLFHLSRKGKYLFFHFSKLILGFHLGLTGSLILHKVGENMVAVKHTVLGLTFSESLVIFSDMRKFGKVYLFYNSESFQKFLRGIGPDALEIEISEFKGRLKGVRKPIKSTLLDQKIISGIGNIYADEILFRAELNPQRLTSSLSDVELERLYKTMKEVLNLAIELRGSTIKDYVDGLGRTGMFQNKHLVYKKYGKPCSRCGATIQKIKISGRTTSFCPQCQR